MTVKFVAYVHKKWRLMLLMLQAKKNLIQIIVTQINLI